MTLSEIAKALGVAMFVLVLTIAASFPMVAFYATFIEPGHPPDFYTEAALWIAPWSSFILGPIAFFICVYWLSKSNRVSRPITFAATAFAFYLLVDIVIIPILIGIPISSMATIGMLITLGSKLIAALLGAHFSLSGRVSG